jgi:hypothetical protein
MQREIRGKLHFETGECRNDVLAMEHLDDKMRLNFDALVPHRFEGPLHSDRRMLSIRSSTIG